MVLKYVQEFLYEPIRDPTFKFFM